ncbi:MAG TPA: M13 family metallopeptidase N-terminal domain-containing protein, partial [Candidatus Angelobacter sp.]|nr:M13 family metallopeptidase N-terminal domain-containing protein [Candidatus Angelobacter sp.]
MKITSKHFAAAFSALFVSFLISAFAQEQASKPEVHGIQVANMDQSVVPGDDFYTYANGAWIKRTEIPPDRPGVSVFARLSDLSNKRTAAVIEEDAKSNALAGSSERQIADLYNSFMNEA